MALYAFDGTGNEPHEDDGQNSNVYKFYCAYEDAVNGVGENFYVSGVGTRYSLIGKILGTVMGTGGRARINEAIEQLVKNLQAGDSTIDIVGFSRGAGLALEFAHEVRDSKQLAERALNVRFLGLWDTVGSFGIPGNSVNVSYNLTVPPHVSHCRHAIALDERRDSFPLTRMVQDRFSDGGTPVDLDEVWFRGFHSDVGGGNGNPALSDIALHWMYTQATAKHLSLDASRVAKTQQGRNPDAACKKPGMDLVADRKRTIQANDRVHETVSRRETVDFDAKGFEANNPPGGLDVVNDQGVVVAAFPMP